MPENFLRDWWTPEGQGAKAYYILIAVMVFFVIFFEFPSMQNEKTVQALKVTPHYLAIESLMDHFKGEGHLVKEMKLGSNVRGTTDVFEIKYRVKDLETREVYYYTWTVKLPPSFIDGPNYGVGRTFDNIELNPVSDEAKGVSDYIDSYIAEHLDIDENSQ